MTFTKSMQTVTVCGITLLFLSCTNKSDTSTDSSSGSCSNATIGMAASTITSTNTNTIPVYVADSTTTGQVGYTNEPVISVTICTPNHTSSTQCQTISNVLVDTGSYGLRLFGSAINVALTQQTVTVNSTSYNLGQCEVFGSGADWGAVKTADVQLGNQTATNIPIQVIDYNFSVMPSACADLHPDTDPCTAGYNGIIGVGVFAQDCGSDCNSTATATNPGNYFACNSSQCANAYTGACSGGVCAIPIPLSEQVVNPVTQFPTNFNNGLSLTLPSVGSTGASAVQGTMTFGINSTAGNVPASTVVVYPADASGMTDGHGMDFITVFNGTTYGGAASSNPAFLDSGSNGLFFNGTSAGLSECTGSSFFCSTASKSATIEGYLTTPSIGISFSVANTNTLASSGNTCFSNLAGQQSTIFDWGLPFFLGRTVYVGFDGKSATYNAGSSTGPYWGF